MDGFVAFLCYAFLGAAIILAILTFLFKKKQLQHWIYVTLSAAALMFIAYQFLPTSDTHKQSNVSATQKSKNVNDYHSKKISKDKSSTIAKTSSKKSASKSSTKKNSKIISKKSSSVSTSKKVAASSSKKEESQPSTKSNLTPIQKISKNVENSYFSGATVKNNILTFVLKNDDVIDALSGFKVQQKAVLLRCMDVLEKYKDDPLAKNGIVISGAYVKMEDGGKEAMLTIFYTKNSLNTIDFGISSEQYTEPLNVLSKSDYYHLLISVLRQYNAVGIFKGITGAYYTDPNVIPEWVPQVADGEIIIKPTK